MDQSKPLTRAHWLVLIAAFSGWMFDGLEMGLFPIVARPALQDLMQVTDEATIGAWNGYIVALFLVGAACGGLLFGWLGDKIGRVRTMMLSILCYSFFTGCCYFAQAAWHLGAFRFLAALGMGGEWSLGVALVMECWPEKLRPLMAGIIGAAANVGFLLIAWVGWMIPVTVDSWRWMFLVGAVPALLTIFIRIFVPESERWKESVKHTTTHPLREILSPGLLRPTLLAIAFGAIALIGTWGAVSGFLPLWTDQLAGGDSSAKATIQIVLSIGAIIGCIGAPLIGSKIGRRPAYFGLCLASLLICGFMFRGLTEYNWLFIVTAGLAGCATASFYGWLPLYLPELFPTRVRATGQGLSFNTGRILAAFGAIYAGQLVLFFEKYHPGEGYARSGATITLVYILGMILIWFAPETKGKPLPD